MSAVERPALPRLVEVLDLTREVVDLEPLIAVLAETDLEVGTFTDEELHWASPDPDARSSDPLEAPRLSRQPETEQRAALDAVLWQLLARGDAEWDGKALRLTGTLSLVGELRFGSEAAVSVQVDTHDDGPWPRLAGLLRIRPEVFLVEYVAPEGLHRLVCCGGEPAAARLACLLDPLGRAGETGPLRHDADALAGEARLLDAAVSTAVIVFGDVDGTSRTATCYGTDEGLHAAQVTEARGEAARDEAEMFSQRLSARDLARFCARFLAREPEAGIGEGARGRSTGDAGNGR